MSTNPSTEKRPYPPDVRQRPKLDIGSDRGIFLTMCEGNPGALQVLMKLAEDPMGLMFILDLDDMGMRGSQIWIAWKDHCKCDLEVFKKALRDRDPAMVATVNAHRGTAPGTPQAVTGGASR